VDEYRVTVKVRNNYFLNAMENAGVPTGMALSKNTGVPLAAIYGYLGLKRTPTSPITGEFRDDIETIAAFLGVSVFDLFPEAHMTRTLKTNVADTTMSFDALQMMIGCAEQSTPEDALMLKDRNNALNDIVSELTARDRAVIEGRFYDGDTLRDVGRNIGTSAERTRQIEIRALRKIRKLAEARAE